MHTYEIRTGNWYNPAGQFVSKGYSGGNCGANPEGINNPDMTGIKDIGPLPVGLYRRGVMVPNGHLGLEAIQLIPDPSNNMLGRGGFYLHGDTTPGGRASEGCIIQPRATRDAFLALPDDQVNVVVDFTSAN